MVHRVDKKYYFEILMLLDKDMLLVSRLSKLPSNLVVDINAGSETNEQLVIWQRFQDKIQLN
jgi:hypothetical protein